MAKQKITTLEENLWNAADKLRSDGGVSANYGNWNNVVNFIEHIQL